MKRPFKILFTLTVALGATATLGWLPQPGDEAPPLRRHLQMLRQAREKDPQAPQRLLSHLRQKYPDFESHVLKAGLSLQDKYPSLIYSLPRHLLEDLQGEPLQALSDVAVAEVSKYPNLPQKLAEMRRQPRARALRELVATNYPGLATRFLEFVGDNPTPRAHIGADIRQVMGEQFPDLRRQVLLEVSRLVDERYPTLPGELLQRGDERPLAFVSRTHPDFIPELMRRVDAKQGPEIRKAAVALLTQLEKDPAAAPGPWMGKALTFVGTNYPGLIPQLVDLRMKNRQRVLAGLREEFPELIPLAISTIRDKHPGLPKRMLAVVDHHYPTLRNDVKEALERELPGLEKEVSTWLSAQ